VPPAYWCFSIILPNQMVGWCHVVAKTKRLGGVVDQCSQLLACGNP
jgi:hypothetical protein